MLGGEAQNLDIVRWPKQESRLEEKREMARQMKIDCMLLERLHKYTDLFITEIESR